MGIETMFRNSAIPDIRLPACLGQQCIGYLPFGHVSW